MELVFREVWASAPFVAFTATKTITAMEQNAWRRVTSGSDNRCLVLLTLAIESVVIFNVHALCEDYLRVGNTTRTFLSYHHANV